MRFLLHCSQLHYIARNDCKRRVAWGFKDEVALLLCRFTRRINAMASCPKCGKPQVRKDTQKRKRCRHCGILPGPMKLGRTGCPSPRISTGQAFRTVAEGRSNA
jgi:ribosomal protein L37AE/L43A